MAEIEMVLLNQLKAENLNLRLYRLSAEEVEAAMQGLSKGQCVQKLDEVHQFISTEIRNGQRKIERLKSQARKLELWAAYYKDEIQARQMALGLWQERKKQLQDQPHSRGEQWAPETLKWAAEQGLYSALSHPEEFFQHHPEEYQPERPRGHFLAILRQSLEYPECSEPSAGSQPEGRTSMSQPADAGSNQVLSRGRHVTYRERQFHN